MHQTRATVPWTDQTPSQPVISKVKTDLIWRLHVRELQKGSLVTHGLKQHTQYAFATRRNQQYSQLTIWACAPVGTSGIDG